jgi:hypothetical protein
MGHHQKPWIILKSLVQPESVGFHFWAYGRAMNEEKINGIDLAFKIGRGHQLTILINKFKVWNTAVKGISIWENVSLPQNRQAIRMLARRQKSKQKHQNKDAHHVIVF